MRFSVRFNLILVLTTAPKVLLITSSPADLRPRCYFSFFVASLAGFDCCSPRRRDDDGGRTDPAKQARQGKFEFLHSCILDVCEILIP